MPGIEYACELGEFDRLLDDPFEGLEVANGVLTLPSGPGSGVRLIGQKSERMVRSA
jgi:L-alanine-DL-glutamate epimerase-like enolase superfamily enzyme